MTFRNGFIMGLIAGSILAYMALGYTGGAENQQSAIQIIISFSIASVIATIYVVLRRRSFINTTVNGFIVGVSLSATSISWLLYGISYP